MAVLEYFASDHVEMVTATAASVAITTSAVWLFTQSRSAFALAFLITTALAAVLISAGFASLARDTARAEELGAVVRTGQPAAITAGEQERMVVVLSECRYYRYGAAVLATSAVAGTPLSQRGWVIASPRLLGQPPRWPKGFPSAV